MPLSEIEARGYVSLMLRMEVEIEVKVINATSPASSVSLSKDVMHAFDLLRKAMYPVCPVYNTGLRILTQEQKSNKGQALAEFHYFLLTDLQYSGSRGQDDGNFRHNLFHCGNLKTASELGRRN